MSDVISLADHSENGKLWSPIDALEDAIVSIKEGDGAFNPDLKKILIIALDDNDSEHIVGFIQSGMSMTECIGVCDVAQAKFRRNMGY